MDTNELCTNKDVLQALKWRSEVVGPHDDDGREGAKRSRRRGEASRERRNGDGGEESRTDPGEKSERESEVDDPLLQRLGQVKGQKLRRNSSKARERGDADDNDGRETDKREEDEADKVRRKESVKSQRDGEDMRKVERRDSRKGEVRRKDSERRRKEETKQREEEREMESRDDEHKREMTGSQWVRPSKDFWSGRIPGVVQQSSAHQNGQDALDGGIGNLRTGMQGISGQEHGIPNGTLHGVSSNLRHAKHSWPAC